MSDRVVVVEDDAGRPLRAEARRWLAAATLVTARGFGPPSTTVQATAQWLQAGGLAMVSGEPVLNRDRWVGADLAAAGMSCDRLVRHRGTNWVVLRRL